MLCLFRQSFLFLLSQLNGSGVQPSLSSDAKNRKNKEFTLKKFGKNSLRNAVYDYYYYYPKEIN